MSSSEAMIDMAIIANLKKERTELVAKMAQVRTHVRAIYSHYSATEIATALASNSGSQLYHYAVALELLDAALEVRSEK